MFIGNANSADVILKELANKQRHKYIIPYNSGAKQIWDVLIVLLGIFFYILNTLTIAFKPPIYYTHAFDEICLAIDGIFLIDILVLFRTSKLNIQSGEEISDPKVLAQNYVLSLRFWIDIVSIIPFEMIQAHELLTLLSLLKITRIRRI